MNLRTIQCKIRTGHYTITDHALIESFKDGVDLNDILRVILTGRVVETYPGRQRVLIGGWTAEKKRLHVVVGRYKNRTCDCDCLRAGSKTLDEEKGHEMKKNGKRKCPDCSGPMTLGKTTLHFERGSFYADVENVSAYLCGRCGSRSLPGPIAAQVSATVNSLFKSVHTRKGTSPFSGISFHKAAA